MDEKNNKKILLISFLIIFTYMIVEAVGGFVTNSLALLSDAGHMLSDAVSLGIALVAFQLAAKATTHEKTFGYKRFEILAAALNGLTLILIALFIFWEAIGRFTNPPAVATTGMLIIATIGLLVNIVVAVIMFKGADTEDNLNMRGAFLHVISDMLGSVGAIIAALLIIFFGWGWADPLASVIVAALVLRSGVKVTREALHILMEGTPRSISIPAIVALMEKVEGVQAVHDLHVWTITSGIHALSAHIVVDGDLTVRQAEQIIQVLEHDLGHVGIQHTTLQFETAAHLHDRTLLCTLEAPAADLHAHHHH